MMTMMVMMTIFKSPQVPPIASVKQAAHLHTAWNCPRQGHFDDLYDDRDDDDNDLDDDGDDSDDGDDNTCCLKQSL